MLHALGLEGLLDFEETGPDADAQRLLDDREAARAGRDFGVADRLRDELGDLGWEIRDTPGGARLVRRSP